MRSVIPGLCAVLCCSSAWGQAAPGPLPEAIPASAPSSAPSEPPALPALPAVPASAPSEAPVPVQVLPPSPPPEKAAPPSAPKIKFYGIIKPTTAFSSAAVESFGQPNASAITAAANPALASSADAERLTFQIAQSRVGVWIDPVTSVRAHVEIDFFDAAKSSPTTASLPRLRIAAVEWAVTEQTTVVAGQDWDLFAALNPYGINMVGGGFLSGNVAFMRQQVKALHKQGKGELAAALGLQTNNNSNRDNGIELSATPTAALRYTRDLGENGKIGAAVIGTSLLFAPDTDNERRAFAGGAVAFGEVSPVADLSLRFEAYGGSNLANLGMLSLAQGRADQDLQEAGGFVSLKQQFTTEHKAYATVGVASVLNPGDLLPSYAYPGATPDGPAPALGTAVLAGTGFGLANNFSARLGYEYAPTKGLSVLVEGFAYRSEHALQAVDVERLSAQATALGAEGGILLSF